MIRILSSMKNIPDPRQEWKIKHKLMDIVAIVLFATLANADEWEEIEAFAQVNEELMRKYLELPNGIPSHDTIQRVMSMIEPKALHNLQNLWNEMLNSNEGEKLKKIINIDGKTMRGNGNKSQSALHVISAYSKEDGLCLGQNSVDEKENEIIAIPKLLDEIKVAGHIVTIDAMGTQTKIAEKIIKKKANYVLAVKGNQKNLHKDLIEYFAEENFKEEIKSKGHYRKTIEKAHGQIEKREYYQTDDIEWMPEKQRFQGIKSIGIVEKTIDNDKGISKEIRYYISSLPVDIELFSRSVRGHWAIESMHWHLDVTFREDANQTLEKTAAQNMNIIRKLALSVLRLLNVGKKCSLKKKRFIISISGMKYWEQILSL